MRLWVGGSNEADLAVAQMQLRRTGEEVRRSRAVNDSLLSFVVVVVVESYKVVPRREGLVGNWPWSRHLWDVIHAPASSSCLIQPSRLRRRRRFEFIFGINGYVIHGHGSQFKSSIFLIQSSSIHISAKPIDLRFYARHENAQSSSKSANPRLHIRHPVIAPTHPARCCNINTTITRRTITAIAIHSLTHSKSQTPAESRYLRVQKPYGPQKSQLEARPASFSIHARND